MALTPDVESVGYIVLVTAWVCPSITLPVFGLRLFAALHVLRQWHFDDTLMVLAVVFAVANSIVNSLQVENGLGSHMADVSPEMLVSYNKLNITGSLTTYNLATMCTKTSILLYYLRFPSSRRFRLATYLVILISVGYTASGALAWAYSCSPIEKSWYGGMDGTCINTSAALLTRSVLNVVTDLAILMLPVWLLWPLQLWSVWQKLSVLAVLMAGGFVCVASILRLAAFWTDKGATEEDLTWHFVKNTSWCLLESWVGVFCACLPSLKCLVVHYFPGVFSWDRNRGIRMSLLSMIRISGTDQEGGGTSIEGSRQGARRIANRLRKKPSYGSSELDVEAQRERGRDQRHSTDAVS